MNIIDYHKKFKTYNDIYKNKNCYLFGTGRTINDFNHKKTENDIYIGVNHILKHEKITNELDFYFYGHGYMIYNNDKGIYGNYKKLVDELDKNIQKVCIVSRNNDYRIHNFNKKKILQMIKNNILVADVNLDIIHKDISENSFINHSIIFSAYQFAVYSGCTNIYLVGCDCTTAENTDTNNFYNKEKKVLELWDNVVEWWNKIKEFKDKHYKKSKIININPVNLKGLMDDDIYLS